MNNSRGQAKLVLPPIFVAAIGLGIVFLSILYAVIQIGSNEAYLRQLYITGLGLDLQSLQALGNDVNAVRDITDAGAYYLVFEGTKVYTRERGVATSTFIFTQSPGFFFRGGEFVPEKSKTIGPLKLFKSGKFYGVQKPDKVQSPYLLTCDTPKGNQLKKIALDPGHGYDSTTSTGSAGYTINTLGMPESKYTLLLANLINAGRTRFEFTRSNKNDSDASIESRKNTPGDALISLHAGIRDDNIDVIKAYYNSAPGSRRLACEILNSLAAEFNIPVRPIPVNIERLSPDDPKQILDTRRPAVLLEIGNSKKTDSLLAKTGNLALAIYKGVEEYGMG